MAVATNALWDLSVLVYITFNLWPDGNTGHLMHFGAFYALIALKIRKIVLTSAFFIWTWRNLVHAWSTPIPKGHMILVAMVTNFVGNFGCHGYQISRYTQIAMAKSRGKTYTYVWYIIGKRRPLAIQSWLYNFSIYPSSKVIKCLSFYFEYSTAKIIFNPLYLRL